MRFVLTNDDGIESPGLHALAATCNDLGHECVVVAPLRDMSGSSAAVGRIDFGSKLELHPAELPVQAAGIEAYAIDGPPGLAALLAATGAVGDPPDLVLSGINGGPNTGHSILHSGTVGAALTAGSFGLSALAISLDMADPMPWETACAMVPQALQILLDAPTPTVLNLNAPARPANPVPELRWASLDRFGSFRVAVAERREHLLQLEYRATGAQLDPDSDTALLESGFATITAIGGIEEIPADELASQPRHAVPRPHLTTAPRTDPSI